MRVKILYEDADIIVVVKPAGMPSQGDRSSAMDMVSYLKNYLAPSVKGIPYIGIVHRLDRPVGGVMVYARTPKAAADLSAQIQKKRVTKKYQAVLTGTLDNHEGRLQNYLLKDAGKNTSKIVSGQTPGAKPAALDYKVIHTQYVDGQWLTLTDIQLITGRHHQIRVQTAGAGAGVYGDTKYNPHFQDQKGWFDMGLFAYSLSFLHPTTHKRVTFTCAPEGKPFSLLEG